MINRTKGLGKHIHFYYIEDHVIYYILCFYFYKNHDGAMKTNYYMYIKGKYV